MNLPTEIFVDSEIENTTASPIRKPVFSMTPSKRTKAI